MLAALLLNSVIGAMFEASAEDDALAFHARLSQRLPPIAPILDLGKLDPHGAHLVLEPVEISVDDYPALRVEDFMVSLYNDRTVPRVLIAWPDGRRADIHEVLAGALAALAALDDDARS